jgi:hypothetical protein
LKRFSYILKWILKDLFKLLLFTAFHLTLQIWEEYYKEKEVIAAAVPSLMYDTIYSRSQQFPVVSIFNSLAYEFLDIVTYDSTVIVEPFSRPYYVFCILFFYKYEFLNSYHFRLVQINSFQATEQIHMLASVFLCCVCVYSVMQ